MRLASLYSGGKDSALATYIASQMGHEITHLVTIRPKGGESWIFHVPNTDMVPLMAESMGLELVTAETTGTEESDMDALKEALSGLEIDGIVTGAIWSDYQWDRMNRICGDMGLVVITPLWRKDQDIVIDDLLDSGIKAMIVGCYAEGLDASWLGREIDRNAVEELRKVREISGISVVGEGGEYESMVLDSPMYRCPISILGSYTERERNGGTLHITEAELAG